MAQKLKERPFGGVTNLSITPGFWNADKKGEAQLCPNPAPVRACKPSTGGCIVSSGVMGHSGAMEMKSSGCTDSNAKSGDEDK